MGVGDEGVEGAGLLTCGPLTAYARVAPARAMVIIEKGMTTAANLDGM